MVKSIDLQSDGKIFVGGDFTTFNSVSQKKLVRLNADGSKDNSLDIGSGFNNVVSSITLQPDGKLIVGGNFTFFREGAQNRLTRLTISGTRDQSFVIGKGFDNDGYHVALQPDGKMLVGGKFTSFNGDSQNRLTRLNADGSRDYSFNIGTGFNSSMGSGYNETRPIVLQPDGKILVGGAFDTFNGGSQRSLVRLHSDGTKDNSFDIGTGFDLFSIVQSIALQPNGKILVGGTFSTFNGVNQPKLIRLNANGTYDNSFASHVFENSVNEVVVQPDGKILVCGFFVVLDGLAQKRLVRLNVDGTKDTSFDIGTGFNNWAASIELQPDGKILVSGPFESYNGETQNQIVRLNVDGSRDTTFDVGTGFLQPSGFGGNVNILLQPDGKVIAAGVFNSFDGAPQNHLVRLNSDGSKDLSVDIGAGFND